MLSGKVPIPTALLTPMPFSSPQTFAKSSLHPLMMNGCFSKSVVQLTIPSTLITLLTRLRLPRIRFQRGQDSESNLTRSELTLIGIHVFPDAPDNERTVFLHGTMAGDINPALVNDQQGFVNAQRFRAGGRLRPSAAKFDSGVLSIVIKWIEFNILILNFFLFYKSQSGTVR